VNDLRSKGEEGGKEWHKFLRGERTVTQDVKELIVNGVCITEMDEMASATRTYWEDIGGVNEAEREVNVDFKLVTRMLDDMDVEPQLEEVKKVVERLKNDKAAGCDEIPYEMYKFGGEFMVKKLHELYVEIWKEERVPSEWNESRVTLIHKGGCKSKKELKNYRPIALADTVGKIFCMILNERMRVNIERHKVMGEEQNGFRMNRRGEDNMYVVREVIERLKKDGKKGYFAFIDIEKAYDRVDRDVLYKVLDRCGFSEKIVNIVKSMYVETRAKYNLGEIETDWVRSVRGVRQGCVLSPLLFGLYTEELAVRVNQCGQGIKIGNDRLNVLLYADDVVIMSENRNRLQEVFDVVSEYGSDFRVNFSAEKSQVLVVNAGVEDEDEWTLGGRNISRTNEYKYLGIWMDENGCERSKRDKMAKAQQWYGRLGSVAKMRANKYEVVRGLWKGMAVPSLMYGMNVMTMSASECNKLEVCQNRVGRVALGANRYVGVEAIRGDMGWSTFRERVMKSGMNYKIRLERMDRERWPRKVYEWNSGKSKWERGCKKMVNECGFQKLERHRMAGNGLGGWMTLNDRGFGVDWDERKWKTVIDVKVKEIGVRKWRQGMSTKSTLEWYERKARPMSERWYDGSWGSQLLFKARSQSLEVNARTYRWNESRSKVCEMCDLNENETVVHVLVECNRYERERTRLLEVLEGEVGSLITNEWFAREDQGISVVLGFESGMNERCMCAVKVYLSELWSVRERHLSQRVLVGGR
jgi:hypothetical protein